MNDLPGTIVQKLRTEAGFSQKELAEKLRERGVNVTNQAISKWETGTTQMSAAQFLAVCGILGVSDFSEFIRTKRVSELSGLNERGREAAREYISLLKLSDKYTAQQNRNSLRMLPLYNIAASAGTGQFLDGDDYELVEVGDEVPENVTFGVKLAGDSMEPDYHDGDTVWVMRERLLSNGETGLFLYDGSAYCKKLSVSDGKVRLVSLNPSYAPIEVDEERGFRVFGKVVARA